MRRLITPFALCVALILTLFGGMGTRPCRSSRRSAYYDGPRGAPH